MLLRVFFRNIFLIKVLVLIFTVSVIDLESAMHFQKTDLSLADVKKGSTWGSESQPGKREMEDKFCMYLLDQSPLSFSPVQYTKGQGEKKTAVFMIMFQ